MGWFDNQAGRRSGATKLSLKLDNNSKVAVVGGGPAGSFFSYFLLSLAERVGIELTVDIFEPKNFQAPGPSGCNMCAGIISESLIQMLAAEGVNLPPVVAQRGINSYIVHTPYGQTEIRAPEDEKRIATVYRGAGPRDLSENAERRSFDAHLLELAMEKGARQIEERVEKVARHDGRLEVTSKTGRSEMYDLMTMAAGLHGTSAKILADMDLKYKEPVSTKSHIREFNLGKEVVDQHLGSNIHVFLLNIPRLEFAALVPKGDYVTLCLIGEKIDGDMIDAFLSSPQVKECLPADIDPKGSCRCFPQIYVRAAEAPFADRLVFIGDSSASRLYKDGIGAAYRTAKAAATTAIFQGVSADNFEKHYYPTCRRIEKDNRIGRIVFGVNTELQKSKSAMGGVLRMVNREQSRDGGAQRMSSVMWDTFTGSAPYKDIFRRMLHPAFISRFAADIGSEAASSTRRKDDKET